MGGLADPEAGQELHEALVLPGLAAEGDLAASRFVVPATTRATEAAFMDIGPACTNGVQLAHFRQVPVRNPQAVQARGGGDFGRFVHNTVHEFAAVQDAVACKKNFERCLGYCAGNNIRLNRTFTTFTKSELGESLGGASTRRVPTAL